MRQSRQSSIPAHANRLEQLAAAIHTHRVDKPRQRLPQSLRAEVVAVLNAGATVRSVREACKLSGSQITRWRQAAARSDEDVTTSSAAEVVPPRVLSVVDGGAHENSLPDGEIELRIGGWCLSLRRTAQ
jgi:hypothetical protein